MGSKIATQRKINAASKAISRRRLAVHRQNGYQYGQVEKFPAMSQSRVYYQRFHQDAAWRKAIAVIYIGVTLGYLAWRATVLNLDALSLSLVYYVAEIFGFILALTLIFCSWHYRHREPLPPPSGLKVDVFVPAYREAIEVIRRTLTAAQRISYPHQTFLLDDGNRAELKRLAREIGVRYLARAHNTHAKAGNLNYGLAHSRADFVMVLDADHIALPHALNSMLGFFGDASVAMVQTPQDYYNTDAFQYMNARNGGLWHDQSFFYNIAQACRDAHDGASCVGTGVVYRRSALDRIGGIPTLTVTEDFHTSLKLHKAGFKVVYLNEPVAYGIAAADIRDYYKTRHRWAHGNIHALRVERILTCPGLSVAQRLSYLTHGLIYLEGWQQALLFVVPWVSLLLGLPPFDITIFNVLVIIAFPLLATLLLQELGCGLSRYWVNELFAVARFPTHILASFALFTNKMRFRTSAKNIRGKAEWLLLSPQIAIGLISLVALGVGVWRLIWHFKMGPLAEDIFDIAHGNLSAVNWSQRLDSGFTLELVVVAGFWAAFNAAKCFVVVQKAIRDARRSNEHYRFGVRLPMEIDTEAGLVLARVERLSESYISARWYGDAEMPEPGQRLRGRLHLPSGILALECIIRKRECPAIWKFRLGPLAVEVAPAQRQGRLDCDLVLRRGDHHQRLADALYSVDWHREFLHRYAFFATPLSVLKRLLLRQRAEPTPTWSPALCRDADTGHLACAIVGIEPQQKTAILIAFHPMPIGREVTLQILGESQVFAHAARVLVREDLRSLGGRGLDSVVPQKYRLVMDDQHLTGAQEILVAAE